MDLTPIRKESQLNQTDDILHFIPPQNILNESYSFVSD